MSKFKNSFDLLGETEKTDVIQLITSAEEKPATFLAEETKKLVEENKKAKEERRRKKKQEIEAAKKLEEVKKKWAIKAAKRSEEAEKNLVHQDIKTNIFSGGQKNNGFHNQPNLNSQKFASGPKSDDARSVSTTTTATTTGTDGKNYTKRNGSQRREEKKINEQNQGNNAAAAADSSAVVSRPVEKKLGTQQVYTMKEFEELKKEEEDRKIRAANWKNQPSVWHQNRPLVWQQNQPAVQRQQQPAKVQKQPEAGWQQQQANRKNYESNGNLQRVRLEQAKEPEPNASFELKPAEFPTIGSK